MHQTMSDDYQLRASLSSPYHSLPDTTSKLQCDTPPVTFLFPHPIVRQTALSVALTTLPDRIARNPPQSTASLLVEAIDIVSGSARWRDCYDVASGERWFREEERAKGNGCKEGHGHRVGEEM